MTIRTIDGGLVWLYKIGAGRNAQYAYTEDEREVIIKAFEGKRNVGIQRYKGLGEMNAE